MMRGEILGALVVAFAMGVTGCAESSRAVSAWREKGVAPQELLLGEGDVVEVKVFREPDLAAVYRVPRSGDIDFPFIGTVMLRGRSAEDVAEEVRTRLADGYVRAPQVAVFVREYNSQQIHVLGQVKKAGTVPYEVGMTVIGAIARSGGLSSLASPNSVTVTRVVGSKEHTIDVSVGDIRSGDAPDFELQPGDIIFVREAIF